MKRLFLIIGSILCLSSAIFSQLPADFYDEKIWDNFDFPMGLTFDETGQMYVWEKAGRVQIVDTSGNRLAEPLLDISEEVMNWKDHGLTGFALDPNFRTNGYYYILYAADLHHLKFFGTPAYSPDSMIINTATIGRVARYTADAATNYTTTVEGSEKLLLGETITNGIPLMYAFHGLGSLIIGTDGTLLISTGDATSNGGTDTGGDEFGTFASAALTEGIITPDENIGSYKAQYLGSYSGKILRLDPETGDGLPSNPFYDAADPRSPKSRTWSLGFRNPYRISIRPNTGSHYADEGNPGVIMVGDVGNGRWEEVDLVTEGGQNFGWPVFEGNERMYSFAIIDAPFNKMAPNPLYGNGTCENEFFTFRELIVRPRKGQEPTFNNPCDPFQEIPAEVHPMVEQLSALVWNNSKWNPPARAIIPSFADDGGVISPEIIDPESVVEGANFEGFSSLAGVFYTADVFPEEYHNAYFAVDFSGWIKVLRFDDNHQLLSVEPFHDDAINIIHLALNPTNGALYYLNLDNSIRKISYGGNPPPVPVIKTNQSYGVGPLEVQFDASDSYDSNLPITKYEWNFGDGTSSESINPTHTFSASGSQPTSYTVELSVTDELGASATTSEIISLNNTPPSVEISSFEDGDRYPVDRTSLLILEAEVSDQEHAEEDLAYSWRVFFHHNEHFHPEPEERTARSFALLSPLGCAEEEYWYRIELTVTDAAGLSSTDINTIYPYCGNPFVEFVELAAAPEDGFVGLTWTTNLEEELTGFEIQRSSNFFDFEKVGDLSPQGAGSTYLFKDTAPLRGNNIYRIKALKTDRAYTYSNFATTTFPKVLPIVVYPNPAGDSFEVQIKEAKASTVSLELFNASGIRLLSTQWPATIGESLNRKIISSQLINGMYFYRILNGEEEQVGRLMIAK